MCAQSEGPDKGTSLLLELPLSVGSDVNVNVNAAKNSNPASAQPPIGVGPWKGSMNLHRSSLGSLVSESEVFNEINENKDSVLVGGDSVREVLGDDFGDKMVLSLSVLPSLHEVEHEEEREHLTDALTNDIDKDKDKDKDTSKEVVKNKNKDKDNDKGKDNDNDQSLVKSNDKNNGNDTSKVKDKDKDKDKSKGLVEVKDKSSDRGSENDQINNLTRAQEEKKDDDSSKVVSIAGSHVLVVEDSAAARKVHMTHPLMYTYRHDATTHTHPLIHP